MCTGLLVNAWRAEGIWNESLSYLVTITVALRPYSLGVRQNKAQTSRDLDGKKRGAPQDAIFVILS